MATLMTITQRVVTRLSMIGGTAVQLYAEEKIALFVIHQYEQAIDKYWWPDQMFWHSTTLSAAGIPVGLSTVALNARDVQFIFYKDDTKPLPRVPGRYNPRLIVVQNQKPRYWEPLSKDAGIARVLPLGSNGDPVNVRCRNRIELTLDPDIEVPMDALLLELGAAWEFLKDDTQGQGAAKDVRALYEDRFNELRKGWNDDDIPLPMRVSDEFPTQWQELP